MIGHLKSETVALAVEGADQSNYQGLPVETLYPRQPLWWRVSHHLGCRFQRPIDIDSGQRQRLAAVIAQYQVDTLLFQFINYAVLFEPVLQSFSGPAFFHGHGYDTTWDMRSFTEPSRPRYDEAYPERVRALAKQGCFIANSQHMAERLQAIDIPASRTVVKYFGVTCGKDLPSPTARQLLYVGRFAECKGPDLVIQVFERACERGFDGTLLMLGDGDLMDQCQTLRNRSPYSERIHLHGPADPETCAAAYQASLLLLTHNLKGPRTRQEEAFGVVFLEAMAHSLPVVSTRSGGIPEIVVPDETGYLAEPGDLDTQVVQILQLANDPELRRRMGENGQQRVREHFSADRERAELRRLLSAAKA